MRYELHISRWARHYWGRVEGEHARSCHGSLHYNAPESRGKLTCSEGHELPRQVTWDVEATWDETRYMRYADAGFKGDGPCQFRDEASLTEAARRRFLGLDPARWWEEQHVTGQPGDILVLDGEVIAEIPAEPSGRPEDQEESCRS